MNVLDRLTNMARRIKPKRRKADPSNDLLAKAIRKVAQEELLDQPAKPERRKRD